MFWCVYFQSRQVQVGGARSVVVVVDSDFEPHRDACAFLKWLQYGAGRSPGTAGTYGSRVCAYLNWAAESGIDWRAPTLDQLAKAILDGQDETVRALTMRNAELVRECAGLQRQLNVANEDLAAARATNRDLMTELNRSARG